MDEQEDDQSNSTTFVIDPNVTELDLSRGRIKELEIPSFCQALSTNTSVTSLDLSGNFFWEISQIQCIASALKQNTSLTRLYLRACNITDEGVALIADSLIANTSLKELMWLDNSLGNEAIERIANLLQTNSTLTTLDLSMCNITDDGGALIADSLIANTSLQVLSLSDNSLGNGAAERIANLLQRNLSLTSLYLSTCNITDEGGALIADSLIANILLKELDFSGNSLGNGAIEHIANLLQRNSTLTTLNLHRCNITDKGGALIADSLIANTLLQKLRLSGNSLGNGAAGRIANLLQRNPSLTSLYLSNNEIGDIGAKCILLAVQNCISVTEIYLSRNPIDLLDEELIVQIVQLLQTNTKLTKFWMDFPSKYHVNQVKILQAMTHNSSLYEFFAPKLLVEQVPQNVIDNIFVYNTTWIDCVDDHLLLSWYCALNEACQETKATLEQRDSVPHNIPENEIKQFLADLVQNSEEWQAMKLVVLGNGQIGKSTLLNEIKKMVCLEGIKTNISSTVGIDVERITLANGEVTIWDFGGQLEYTATHQFFLSVEKIIYLVTFNLQDENSAQMEQILFWLQFLNSALPTARQRSNWQVMLVGLRDDAKHPSTSISKQLLATWQRQFKRLPLYQHEIFFVSAWHSAESVKHLLNKVGEECQRIFDAHSVHIPSSYKRLLTWIQQQNHPNQQEHFISISELCTQYKELKLEVMKRMLRYFHAIGHVVMIDDDFVCTDATVIPKIVANFVCPEDVRAKLFLKRNIEILDEENVKCLLDVDSSSDASLEKEISLMLIMETCYKLQAQDSRIFYLFPSLAQPSKTVSFVHSNNMEGVHMSGMRFRAPKGMVFVPGFFGQLIVNIMKSMNLFKEDIAQFYSNSVVLQCPGLFAGEIVVIMDDNFQSVVIAIQASNPDLLLIVNVFQQVVAARFNQYSGIEPQHLCPVCIKHSLNLKPSIEVSDIGTYYPNRQDGNSNKTCQPYFHTFSDVVHVMPGSGGTCRSHQQDRHHFFLNYRVALEGKPADNMEPKFGLVQMIYDKLAVLKGPDNKPLFVFWDKQCLCYGQDWEQGFFNGLLNSRVIVLLMSSKSLEMIATNAATRQDNVLIEYECALLKNLLDKTPVIPVFVAEKDKDDQHGKPQYTQVSFSTASFPEVAHARGESGIGMLSSLRNKIPAKQTRFLDNIKTTMAAVFKLQGISLPTRGTEADIDRLVKDVLMATLSKDNADRIRSEQLQHSSLLPLSSTSDEQSAIVAESHLTTLPSSTSSSDNNMALSKEPRAQRRYKKKNCMIN